MSTIRCCDLCGKPLIAKAYSRYKIKREWNDYPFDRGWERIEAHDDCVRELLNKRVPPEEEAEYVIPGDCE